MGPLTPVPFPPLPGARGDPAWSGSGDVGFSISRSLDDGPDDYRASYSGVVRQAGQIATTPEALRAFADSLLPDDEVAVEATCNAHAIVKLIAPRVARSETARVAEWRAYRARPLFLDQVAAAVDRAAARRQAEDHFADRGLQQLSTMQEPRQRPRGQ